MPAGRNFLALLAFYLMAMLSRRTGAEIEWHDTRSARAAVADWASITETPFTRLVALAPDQGLLFLPLVWLHDRLFGLGLGQVDKASDYLQSVANELEYDLPMAWWNAAQALGVAAATMLSALAEGRPALPQIASQHARSRRTNTVTLPYEGEDAVARGEASLDDPRENAAWRTFAYNTWINASGTRVPAVSVTVQTYGPSPLRLRMAFRYRPASEGPLLAILDPSVWEFNVPEEIFLRLDAAVRRGARSVRWAVGQVLERLLRGPARAALAAARRRRRAADVCHRRTGTHRRRGAGRRRLAAGAHAAAGAPAPMATWRACSWMRADGAAARRPRRCARACCSSHAARPITCANASPGSSCAAASRRADRTDPNALTSPAHARVALAGLLWQGLGLSRDPASARQLLEAAADAGNAAAELALAVLHLEGRHRQAGCRQGPAAAAQRSRQGPCARARAPGAGARDRAAHPRRHPRRP